jgi:peptidoglycan/LPS O-acetylase OafA/YrhL
MKRSVVARAFHPRLEALRGLATLSVAAFHSWESTWLDPVGQAHRFLDIGATDGALVRFAKFAGRLVANGDGAVIIFFVLSGFVLAGSLERGPQEMAKSACRFLVARLFRIYPAIIVAVLVFAAFFWLTGQSLNAGPESFTPSALLRNALLLEVSVDGVMWSLQVELLAIPFVFAAYFVYRRWGLAALAVMCLVLMGLSFSRTWQHAIEGVHQFGLVFAFIPGVIAYVAAPAVLQRCPPLVARLLLVLAVAAFLLTRPLVGYLSNWSVVLESVFGAVAVALLAFSNVDKRNRLLDASVTRFYGRISYSFYLVHPLALIAKEPVTALIGLALALHLTEGGTAVMVLAASALAVTPLAYAMYRWIERPAIAIGRSLVTESASKTGAP